MRDPPLLGKNPKFVENFIWPLPLIFWKMYKVRKYSKNPEKYGWDLRKKKKILTSFFHPEKKCLKFRKIGKFKHLKGCLEPCVSDLFGSTKDFVVFLFLAIHKGFLCVCHKKSDTFRKHVIEGAWKVKCLTTTDPSTSHP